MHLKVNKLLIYIVLFSIISFFIFSTYSFSFDDDSIYVWSNNSYNVATSITPSNNDENILTENSR